MWPGDNLLNAVDVVNSFPNYSGRGPFPGWLDCVVPWIRGEEGAALVVDMHISNTWMVMLVSSSWHQQQSHWQSEKLGQPNRIMFG